MHHESEGVCGSQTLNVIFVIKVNVMKMCYDPQHHHRDRLNITNYTNEFNN